MSLSKQLRFDRHGLIPAIIRDTTGDVLMMVFMNAEAVERTVETGKVHYWSRSRRRLRMKGETSGNAQEVREISLDGDADCLLISVDQAAPAAHSRHQSSFCRIWDGDKVRSADAAGTMVYTSPGAGDDILAAIYQVIQERRRHPAETSYVASLFHKGLDKVLGKIGEEATEVAIAGKGGEPQQVVYEVADLFFHTLLLLAFYELPPERIYAELRRRFGLSGLDEKASRAK